MVLLFGLSFQPPACTAINPAQMHTWQQELQGEAAEKMFESMLIT